MGKKDKSKKKGKGAEKTAAKTEKKLSSKQKRELAAIGEEDIEKIVLDIENEERKRTQVIEVKVDIPSRRCNFSFIAHPEKEELILFGGEYFNGQKTFVYNDLFFYNIPHNTWTLLKCPSGPPPRCGHQMIATSANKGQLWLFGGEFASPTQSQFYHYRDLWVYHVAKKQWEKIQAPNGPSARSGLRMVYVKKQLIVFGGFHDNLRDYKYFNDLYSFNTDTYKWTKLEPTGTPPAPRSGCCMSALPDGRILIYGGYSKERIKKDVDKGYVFTDAFLLTPDKNDSTGTKWKWVQIKLGGIRFSPRCSMSITTAANNIAYAFGGVFDVEEDEENLSGTFYNDLYSIDLEKLVWHNIHLTEKKDKTGRRRKKDGNGEELEEESENMEEDTETHLQQTQTVVDDGIFTVTIGPTLTSGGGEKVTAKEEPSAFWPSPRMNSGLAVKHGILYLFGGIYEDGDKQLTLHDFYSLDLKKMDEWRILAKDDQSQEWLESGSESDDSSESENESENEQSDGQESPMQVD